MLPEPPWGMHHRLRGRTCRLVLLVFVALVLAALLTPGALAQDAPPSSTGLPEWSRASLTQEDVGPDYDLTQEELLAITTAASYTVRFERRGGPVANAPFEVGSVVILAVSDLGTDELDAIAEALIQNRTGLTAVSGPSVADEARWFAGPWMAADAEDEGYLVVSLSQNAVIAVGMAGPPGTLRQADVAAYATLLWERLAGL